MAVAAIVERYAVEETGEVGAVVEVEAAQEILVGLAAARMLRGDQAGDDFEQFADALQRAGVEIGAPDMALRSSVGDADEVLRTPINDDGGRVAGIGGLVGVERAARKTCNKCRTRKQGAPEVHRCRSTHPVPRIVGRPRPFGNGRYEVLFDIAYVRFGITFRRLRQLHPLPRGRDFGDAGAVQRLTISIDDDLARAFDGLQRHRGYASRSEAVRDLVRQAVETARQDGAAGTQCVASLSYVYDYRVRDLADRLLEVQHAHHDLVVATTHVILDHASSLETMILRGPTDAVRELADRIRAERGVRFGAVNLVSVAPNDDHANAHDHHHHNDGHATPHRG